MKIITFVLFLLFPATLVAEREYYCAFKHLKEGFCKKGDLIFAGEGKGIALYCDFDEPMVPPTSDSYVFCRYLGYKRETRGASKE
ncbi:MAG: hypothetical protein N0C84_05710 [Candidatus Thiodiazotropha taylori]|uniref:Uncharacterized protein n=1 Tax=Candidatus Thiodiazotropha taylori TaxID=2792791 RepID=A0A9E4KAF3_9GAMM|nr:hypothetical protein [Candidatus Thiodiazotropha taylori]MCW4255949.1 hypothetical protein [Candidatus Thiodiazotropha taylori]